MAEETRYGSLEQSSQKDEAIDRFRDKCTLVSVDVYD